MTQRRGTWFLAWGLALSGVAPLGAQARPPLAFTADTSGVLTAIRAVDLRQVCRCPTVILDTVVRRAPKVRMYEILSEPRAFNLTAADLGRLALARHRVAGRQVRSITDRARDTAFAAVAFLPAYAGTRRVLYVIGPPTGVTTAYLISLVRGKAAWRVEGTRTVFDP